MTKKTLEKILLNHPLLNPDSDYNQARRDWLIKALGAGVYGGLGFSLANPAMAQWFGTRQRIQPGRSFSRISGEVRVNGVLATLDTKVEYGDAVATGPNSSASFVVDSDAFQLRANTQMRILARQPASAGSQLIDEGIELIRGAALFVFGRREQARLRVSTSFATIGLRGTGLYLEAEDDRTYFCLCYGETDLTPAAAPDQTEIIQATHHDSPRFIYGEGAENMVTDAPYRSHTDLELAVLEDLVGREVPFPLDDYYDTPRREDY